MPRTAIAFANADISALARSLRDQLVAHGEPPSHVQLLNMLAKACGYRNFQHLKAAAETAPPAPSPPTALPAAGPAPPPSIDQARIARIAGHFAPDGELLRWPSRTNHQELCVRVLWSRLPADMVMDEREISAWLNEHHAFGDAPILRRTMVNLGLVSRTANGRAYRKIPHDLSPDLAALLARIGTG